MRNHLARNQRGFHVDQGRFDLYHAVLGLGFVLVLRPVIRLEEVVVNFHHWIAVTVSSLGEIHYYHIHS